MAKSNIEPIPVDDYPEVEYEPRSEEEVRAAEGRENDVDQIADYHETHPTLELTEQHDPEVMREVLSGETPTKRRRGGRKKAESKEDDEQVAE